MESHVTPAFRKALKAAPKEIRKAAQESYAVFRTDPYDWRLDFKARDKKRRVWTARIIGTGWRVRGAREGDVMIWHRLEDHDRHDARKGKSL